MLHQREIESSASAAERAERHAAVAAGGRNRMAKPPWLPKLHNRRFELAIKQLEPHERDRFFVLLLKEIGRRKLMYELGLLPTK